MPRPAANSFRQLVVWQKAHAFVLATYAFSAAFPRNETYGLATQLRRAAVSVPANIAEGFKRRGKADKLRFLNIAEASLEEVRYYIVLAKDLSYGEHPSLASLADEVARLLATYVRTILSNVPHDG
jgi:four helix bundle protein